MPTDFSLVPKFAMWAHQALSDYSAARCCILNAQFAGFVLAQQSVEKLLKAYLLASRPAGGRWVGDRKVMPRALLDVDPGHDLVAHARLVDLDYPGMHIEPRFASLLERLSWRFQSKYPDQEFKPGTTSGSELDEVDALVIELFLRLPIDRRVRWKMGLHGAVWPIVKPESIRDVHGQLHWISSGNKAFAGSLELLIAEVRQGFECEGQARAGIDSPITSQ